MKPSVNVHIEFLVNIEKIRKGSISCRSISTNNPNILDYLLFGYLLFHDIIRELEIDKKPKIF